MHAYKLAQVDKEYDMHLQAWLHHQVQATEEKGKKQAPVYKNFKDFYDYKKELDKLEGINNENLSIRDKRLTMIARKVNERR